MAGYHLAGKQLPPPIQPIEQPDQCSGKVEQIQLHEIFFYPAAAARFQYGCFRLLHINVDFPFGIWLVKARDLTTLRQVISGVGQSWERRGCNCIKWEGEAEQRQEADDSPPHSKLTVNLTHALKYTTLSREVRKRRTSSTQPLTYLRIHSGCLRYPGIRIGTPMVLGLTFTLAMFLYTITTFWVTYRHSTVRGEDMLRVHCLKIYSIYSTDCPKI